ncbi:MAG TPA: amidase [Dehalococcoidia bacterium]|nr:amidase [Dehalococcoidia bacterium]
MTPWLEDACSLADAIRRGEVKATDTVQASLGAIAASRLNAVCFLDGEGALARAAEVDRRVAAGDDPGVFAGVPMLIKDLEHVAGWPSTHGSVPYRDKIAEYDSTDVSRLRDAGAILLGKSTASEFGLVPYTATKLHGVTRNPWNLERTPGGSSGGSAAAVAGGLVPLASASDGGGSIRIPAAYTGLVGLKPTYGRIPRGPRYRYGPLTSHWCTVSRSVRDTARWLDVCSGYDPRDPHSLPRIDGWERDLGTRDLRGLRVYFSSDLGGLAVLEPEVTRVVTEAAEALIEAAGMQRVEAKIELPENATRWATAGAPSLFLDLKDHWPDCADDLTYEIKAAMQFMDQYRVWHAASVEKFRTAMNEAMADIFEQADIVLCATNPHQAFAAEGPMPSHVGDVRVGRQNNGALTIPGNISGFPAISMPAGLTEDGLPVGLQAYAPRHTGDALLLDLALVLERVRPWPLVAPGAPV